MKPIQTVEDVYPATEELIAELRLASQPGLADVLQHRMHQVAWTARSELFKELQSVLTEALQSQGAALPERLKDQMEQTNRVIAGYLNNSES